MSFGVCDMADVVSSRLHCTLVHAESENRSVLFVYSSTGISKPGNTLLLRHQSYFHETCRVFHVSMQAEGNRDGESKSCFRATVKEVQEQRRTD